ncbi:hypothetical protein [Pseudomonas sp. MWU12-2323]|uniref:hypothetical protein n=1 Tax=Pseudomonas sp. MWU12-2323 TaxID=2651296 RepID=UPI00128C1FC3|nr:hypothetical protein [Pseudomonas sp. MWU12-2323]MPQ71475.1 hypothetical protein [Pseudomonas sp. MWU12-2323]
MNMKPITAILGVVLGLGVSYWWLSPAPLPDQLSAAEASSTHDHQESALAEDDAALQGICNAGSVKALPSGKFAACIEDGTWHLPTAQSVKYTIGLIELSQTVDKELAHAAGEKLSKSTNVTLRSVAQELSGNGTFSVLYSNSASSVEGEPIQFVKFVTDENTIPVQIGHRSEGISERASVGFNIVVVPGVIDAAKGQVETTIRILHSVKDQDGNIVTADVRDKKVMTRGGVDILSWEAAGKQYALGILLDDFNQ